MNKLSIAEMTANILRVYDSATDAQYREGCDWYPSMRRLMSEYVANDTRLSIYQVAAVFAATSINTQWQQNVALATRALAEHAAGVTPFENGGTLGMIIRKVRAILACDSHDISAINDALVSDKNNHKVRSFAGNMSGDYYLVTVDRWANRIATGENHVPTGGSYMNIAAAYINAANERNVPPAMMQAVTWCVARGTGK